MPKVTGVPGVRFNLNSAKATNKPTSILAVFRYANDNGSHRLLYSTRLTILPKHWMPKAYTPRPNFADYDHYKSTLSDVSKAIRDIYLQDPRNAPDPEAFKAELDYRLQRMERPSVDAGIPTLLDFATAYSEERKAAVDAKRGTWKKFFTVANHLKDFAKDERNGVLDFKDIDWNWRKDFLNWLYRAPRKHSINNAAKIVGITKQFLNEARKRGYHNNLIFQERDFGVTKKQIKHITLDFDRLRILAKLDLSKNARLDRVRDLFLIGAYSGLRISDYKRIRPQHIVKDGKYEMIQLNTVKTNTDVFVPLLPELRSILQKHKYNSPKPLSDQKMNEYLKELCKLAGFTDLVMYTYSESGKVFEDKAPRWSLITSHSARRSFATNFYELGIPAAHLMAITGHATEKQFFAYINVNKKQLAQKMAVQAFELMKKNTP